MEMIALFTSNVWRIRSNAVLNSSDCNLLPSSYAEYFVCIISISEIIETQQGRFHYPKVQM